MNNNEKELSNAEKLLIKKLKAFCNEFDLIFGVSLMCTGERASREMLQYIDNHDNLTISDILEYAVCLCEKYHPDLIEE